MNILERLIEKLEKMTREFNALVEDNKRLRAELDAIKVEKEKLERKSKEAILTIKNKLREVK